MAMQEMAEMMLMGDTWLAVVKVRRKKPSTTVTLLATFKRACWMGLNMLKITVMLMMLYVAWNNPDDTSMATVALCRLMKVENRKTTESVLNVRKKSQGKPNSTRPTGNYV